MKAAATDTTPPQADGSPRKTAVVNEGIAQKCTLCYDRIGAGQQPACAQTCPTTSIQFGDLSDMRRRAQARSGHVARQLVRQRPEHRPLRIAADRIAGEARDLDEMVAIARHRADQPAPHRP